MKKILIFGGSGFLGKAIYKELNPFFDVYSTYYSNKNFKKNKRFTYFDIKDSPKDLINSTKPNVIISSLRGNFEQQVIFHHKLVPICEKKQIKLFFISSSNVFDSFTNYPSYEFDKTFSESIYGKFKIAIENKILRMKSDNWIILRSPIIFDRNSPRIDELKLSTKNNLPIEVFPNLVVNINSSVIIAKQIHYFLSREIKGIVHVGSQDLILHDELIFSLVKKLNLKKPTYKYVYTTNDKRFLALFSNRNIIPNHLKFSYEDIMKELTKNNKKMD